jgi:hypothetical protein
MTKRKYWGSSAKHAMRKDKEESLYTAVPSDVQTDFMWNETVSSTKVNILWLGQLQW